MALGLLFTGPLSDAVGRKSVMVVSLILVASFTLLSAFMISWQAILLTRACIGLSLSGVAAVAMTYLSEEIHPNVVAFSMGLYISGNSIGGMSGRLHWFDGAAGRADVLAYIDRVVPFPPAIIETPQFGNQFPPALA